MGVPEPSEPFLPMPLSWILKMKSGFLLKRINISANQMISDDSKSVNNRHVRFGSITRLEKVEIGRGVPIIGLAKI